MTKIEGSRAGKTAGALVPVKTAKQALAVPDTANEAIVREKGVTLVVAQPYAMRDRTIVPDQAFYVKDVKSKAEGPWLHEADKLAWRDEATGYECIILRSDAGGHLCGYVGIPPSHPLYGVKHQAIPEDLDIEVHGGLSYSRICESGPSPRPTRLAVEARRICHVICNVPVHRPRELRHATTYRVEDGDAWWLGLI